jgi:hypothetical protein
MKLFFKGTYEDNFSAFYEAEKHLKENGYSVGSMCQNGPIYFKKGNFRIAKCRNMSDEDRKICDGYMKCDDFRNADVILVFTNTISQN